MAALIRRPVLHISLNPDDFLGISEAEEDGTFIVSCAKTASHLVDVRSGKTKASWFLSPGCAICHKIIFDPHGKTFLTLTKQNELRSFGVSEKIEKAEKLTTAVDIHEILVFEKTEAVLLLRTGQLISRSNANDIVDSSGDQNKALIFSAQTKSNGDNIVIVMSIDQEQNNIILKSWRVEDLTEPVAETIASLDRNVSVKSVCSCEDLKGLKILALLSNGQILCSQFYFNNKQFDTSSVMQKIEAHSPEMKVYSIASAEHIVLAPTTKNQKSTESGIGIWNINYCNLQAWIENDDQIQSLSTCQDYVFLVGRGELQPYFVRFDQSSLINVVGKSSKSEVSNSDSILVSWRVHKTSEKNRYHSLRELLDKVIEKHATEESFLSVLQNFTGALPRSLDPSASILIQPKVDKIWQMCIDKKLCPANSLSSLLKLDLVSRHMLPEIIELILVNRATELLEMVITLQNIPEKSVVQIVSYILKNVKHSKLNDQGSDDHDCENYQLLKRVLSLPYSDVFLLESLQDMNFDEVLTLLEYFMDYFSSTAVMDKESEAKVVDWLNILIDAHFTQLILSPDAHPHLIKLHEVIVNEVQYLDECIQLQAVLVQLKEKCALPQKNDVGMYCIEVLEF